MVAPPAPAGPPRIFSPTRRRARRARARALQAQGDAARWFFEDMADDVIERLGFLRHEVRRALVVGDLAEVVGPALVALGAEVVRADPVAGPGVLRLDEERPWAESGVAGGFDLLVSVGTLDTVNDLPGALIHARMALAPGGLFLAAFAGAGSLPVLRAAMQAADGERPAARMHPAVDVRAGAQLLQRTGFGYPVADAHTLSLAYRSVERLLGDLRAQALGSVLADVAPLVALGAVREAFLAGADADGRVVETVEVVTLSGWRK